MVLMLEYRSNTLQRFPRLISPVVKICDVMCRLFSVNVSSDDALTGYLLGLSKKLIGQVHFE